MTKPTGHRGPGRPPGARNKRTRELEAATQAAAASIGEAIPGAFDGDAHAFLMAVYKDPAHPIELRIDAAKAAVRYEKPALAAIDMTSTNENVTYVVSDRAMSQEEWEAEYCKPDVH